MENIFQARIKVGRIKLGFIPTSLRVEIHCKMYSINIMVILQFFVHGGDVVRIHLVMMKVAQMLPTFVERLKTTLLLQMEHVAEARWRCHLNLVH